MTNVIAQFEGKNMDSRVVPARGVDGKIGYFEVQYEYSRNKNQWRYHTDNKGHIKIFYNLANAKAAAKRIPW